MTSHLKIIHLLLSSRIEWWRYNYLLYNLKNKWIKIGLSRYFSAMYLMYLKIKFFFLWKYIYKILDTFYQFLSYSNRFYYISNHFSEIKTILQCAFVKRSRFKVTCKNWHFWQTNLCQKIQIIVYLRNNMQRKF